MTQQSTPALPLGLSSSRTRHTESRRWLKERLNSRVQILIPGVFDALSARLVERAGFEACYVTGAGVANSQLAMPDVGLLTLTEMVEQTRRIIDATALPTIVDCDAGHGGPMSVIRAVHMLEDAGATAVQIEDQQSPKRCGHFDRHELVAIAEMQAKVAAAVHGRSDENLMVIARTDALGVAGASLSSAIERAREYAAAGADALFVEAPRTIQELREIADSLPDLPLIANVVEGGKSPHLGSREFAHMGYGVVLHANYLLRAMAKAGQDALAHLREEGESISVADTLLGWDERQNIVNLEAFDLIDTTFDPGSPFLPPTVNSSLDRTASGARHD